MTINLINMKIKFMARNWLCKQPYAFPGFIIIGNGVEQFRYIILWNGTNFLSCAIDMLWVKNI